MILNIYAMKNRLTGVFDRPFVEQVDVSDYAEAITQALSLASPVELSRHKEYDVYSLGKFDTKTAEIKSCCEFVVSLEPICLALVKVKEIQDVREQESA